MSVYNVKRRCLDLNITLTELFNETKAKAMKQDPLKYQNVTYQVFCNMHRGRYNYGIGPEFMRIANEVLSEKESAQKKVR